MNKKVAIFMMGIPGSGKSHYVEENLKDFLLLDCDKIKETLPGYNPLNPAIVHQESKRLLEVEFKRAIQRDRSFILDGTGTNTDKLLYRIDKAKEQGFYIVLIYIKVNLETALRRNKTRERRVSEEIIREKHKLIEYSYRAILPFVNEGRLVNND